MKHKDYPVIYRLVHWAMALTFSLLLLTILLRMGWMNKYGMAEIVQERLKALGRPPLSFEEAKDLGKALRRPMWHWHFILGYILIGLMCLRFLLPAWGKMKFQHPMTRGISSREKFQRWIYLIFYGLVVISLITGMIALHWPAYKHRFYIVDIHKLSVYYLVGYILLHIGSVIYAEFGKEKGIVSRIIGGNRQRKTSSTAFLKKDVKKKSAS